MIDRHELAIAANVLKRSVPRMEPRPGFALPWNDIAVFVLLTTIAVLIARGAEGMTEPLARLRVAPVTLDPVNLPGYALRTTLRMFAALGASLVFTFVAAALAAKSRRAEMLIIPALDILQSVPILGFLTFTVTFFMGMFPGRQLGVELAAIFAIFTSQAWNMAFSFYQSLRTVPEDLNEVSTSFGLSPWRRFLRLELPFATPALVWNTMMSMSGGWFFVVASEAISVGDTRVLLPGIGSWLALAIDAGDFRSVAWAVAAMAIVILAYDQLVFRPIVAWADRFRFEQTAAQTRPRSWVYDLFRRAWLPGRIAAAIRRAAVYLPSVPRAPVRVVRSTPQRRAAQPLGLWRILVALAVAGGAWVVAGYLSSRLGWSDAREALMLGLFTMARVLALIAIASVIWVPIGMWIGLRPRWAGRLQPVAQFLAAFPANVLFPVVVIAILHWHLDPDVWLSPLMVLGTQWYILFNVIAGASAIPNDLREVAQLNGLRGWSWWKRLGLPAIFPYYVTGALTASGGSWNASIVAEAVSWGQDRIEAAGLGAYIARATAAGDMGRVTLGIAVMSLFVIAFNRLLWRPLYGYAGRRLRLA